MKTLLIIISLLIQIDGSAQTDDKNDSFSHQVTTVKGNLNKDNLLDKVVVKQDLKDEKAPYRLQIFFAQPNGDFKLIVTSTKIIEPQFPEGKDSYKNGNEFLDLTIKNRVISVNNELLRGHFEHKFRFQNGNFELIGFSEVNSEGNGVINYIDFNLLTGIRIEESERYDINKIISNKKKKILIRPLPKLQNFVPFEKDLY